MSDSTKNDDGADNPPQVVPWVQATLDDLANIDFEAPIIDSASADSAELSDLFRVAAGPNENGRLADTPSARVFSMLWAVTGMHFRPREVNDPFGAMMTFADGRRSALPADFRGPAVDVLSHMAERARHPVLIVPLSVV